MQRLIENDVLAMLFHCITYITIILANFGTVGRIFVQHLFFVQPEPVERGHRCPLSPKFQFYFKKGSSKKFPYERRSNESVNEKSLSNLVLKGLRDIMSC